VSPGWVYTRGATAPRRVNGPGNVAVHQNYYGDDEHGKATWDELNRRAENFAPVFKKLVEDPAAIDGHDWLQLSILLANFAVRTPSAIMQLREFQLMFIDAVNEIAGRSGRSRFRVVDEESGDGSSTSTIDEANAHARRLRGADSHLTAVGETFNMLEATAKCINRMSFIILEAPADPFFVTSDRPLVVTSRQGRAGIGVGWGNPDAKATIALCPTRFLIMYYRKEPIDMQRTATPDEAASLNRMTMSCANQEVYGSFEYTETKDWMNGPSTPR
jgi:hypothetical protein